MGVEPSDYQTSVFLHHSHLGFEKQLGLLGFLVFLQGMLKYFFKILLFLVPMPFQVIFVGVKCAFDLCVYGSF